MVRRVKDTTCHESNCSCRQDGCVVEFEVGCETAVKLKLGQTAYTFDFG